MSNLESAASQSPPDHDGSRYAHLSLSGFLQGTLAVIHAGCRVLAYQARRTLLRLSRDIGINPYCDPGVTATTQKDHGSASTPTSPSPGHSITPPSDLQGRDLYRTGSVASPAVSFTSPSSVQRTSSSMARAWCLSKPMQLDRPMDSRLVQHFIRSGDGMRLCLEA